VDIATLPSLGLEPTQRVGAVSESLEEDSPGDLSNLSRGVSKANIG
jgi:hypothetical protein